MLCRGQMPRLLAALALLSIHVAAASMGPGCRLPAEVRPRHYDLELRPDLDAGSFEGRVAVALTLGAPRRWLALHAKGLRLDDASLARADSGRQVALEAVAEEAAAERWVMRAAEELPPGDYLLSAHFTGSLDGKIVGFYRSRYADPSTGQRRYIATSKFEPTYARQAFPCFDEPSFKANFSVRLVRPSNGYSALSNMNVVQEVADSPDTGLTTVRFATSVPMSTYLACFIVSDFQRLEPIPVKNPDGAEFPFSVYSTPAQVNKTLFALQDGVGIAQHYIGFFGIGYPLPKLDMIAIPDFVSGAMEHWGLVTFRETNLLYDAAISSASNQQRVSTVVAHELAHMWFGNLVTLEWWDDLWLNEGFATFMEYKGTNAIHPDWNMMDQFLVDDLHPVLVLDSSLSSHPIVQRVDNPDQITELFDTISYNKGASVIRMLEDFLGAEPFRLGISNFLKKYEFGNAVTANLWEVLQEQVKEDGVSVSAVMDRWTRQMGYPVVNVHRGSDPSVRTLSQKRFLSNPRASFNASDSPYQYKWDIPVTYITSDNTTEVQRTWLASSEDEKEIQLAEANWLKLNSHQVGFYRVNYDADDWETLIGLLQNDSKTLDAADRAHLLDDSFSLASAGQLSYGTAFQLSTYLSHEEDYVPWATAKTHFTGLFHLLRSNNNTHSLLKTYLQNQVEAVYNNLSWDINEADSHLRRRLRVTALELACLCELPACLQQVGNEFDSWLVQPDYRPHPDLRSLIYYYGMAANGSQDSWDQLWQLYLSESDAQEKVKLLYGLSGTPNRDSLQRYLNYSKDESLIRAQDFFIVLGHISANPVGNPIIWDFYRNEWEYLVDRFTLNNRYLGQMVRTISKHFTTQQQLDEMKAFFAKYPNAGAGTAARNQALERVENNIYWVSSFQQDIHDWLSANLGV